jgi:poly [ADP-ribose] polymerase
MNPAKTRNLCIEEAVKIVMDLAAAKTAAFSAHDITRALRRLIETNHLEVGGSKDLPHPPVRKAVHGLFAQGHPQGYHKAASPAGDPPFTLFAPQTGNSIDFQIVVNDILDEFEKTPVKKVSKPKPAKAKKPPVAPTTIPFQPVSNANPTNSSPTMTNIPATDIEQEVTLIFSDVGHNNNKLWRGVLKKNGDVFTEWGRVGKALQSKSYPNGGRRKLEEKEREKLNKGYTRAQVVSGSGAKTTVDNTNLLDLAIKQISKGEPILDKLVHRLVTANIHTITSQSNITFNAATGVFSTPLGVVTLSAILESQRLLDDIAIAVSKGTIGKEADTVNRYLRLVPQDFGMRLDLSKMFPDDSAIQKQRDLLDTLEASYKLVTTQPTQNGADGNDQAKDEPALFDLTIEVCDKKEIERIRKLYKKTRQGIHHYVSNLDVVTAYNIHMPTQKQVFEKYGVPLGNVMELWHGTKAANVLNILRIGLQVSGVATSQRAGALFGPGVYFANCSTKSLNYATDYWHGGGRGSISKGAFMFLADVALGNYMIPPGQRSSTPPKGYNSYFAKAHKSGVVNDEIIIPTPRQALLTRLVEFA